MYDTLTGITSVGHSGQEINIKEVCIHFSQTSRTVVWQSASLVPHPEYSLWVCYHSENVTSEYYTVPAHSDSLRRE